ATGQWNLDHRPPSRPRPAPGASTGRRAGEADRNHSRRDRRDRATKVAHARRGPCRAETARPITSRRTMIANFRTQKRTQKGRAAEGERQRVTATLVVGSSSTATYLNWGYRCG